MKERSIAVINGPNMNMLGKREPEYYGNESWESIELRLKNLGDDLNCNLFFYQSNYEGAIVDFIQQSIGKINGVVINPAAYTKTGYAILEALTAVDIPFVEVHLSNIFSRGGWHSESIFSDRAIGHVMGFKGFTYELGLRAIVNYLESL